MYDWLYFSQNYLKIAKLGCQELIEPKHSKRGGTKNPWRYNIEELIVPILYNTNHGIEIFIKTISLIIDGKYDEGHNIKELFAKLKRKINKLKLKPCKKNGDEITQEMIDDFPGNIKKIEKLINNFYSAEILSEKLGKNFVICDKQNDIFRYPENKASIKINWAEVLPEFEEEGIIKKLEKEIDELYKLFDETGYIIETLKR